MSNSGSGAPRYSKGLAQKIVVVRRFFLRKILQMSGIRNIRGHWVYVKNLNKNSVVIDLGANQAGFSKEIYESFGCKCFAVEPNKDLYDNIEYGFITKLNYAITATNGPVEFYTSNNNEASSILQGFEHIWGYVGKQTVEGIRFADLIGNLGLREDKIEIVKVDVEGAELDLVESLDTRDIINVAQITIEFHDWINEGLHSGTVAAIRKLISMGFRAYTDAPNHKWPIEMLLLNERLIRPNLLQRLLLSIFSRTTFLKYS